MKRRLIIWGASGHARVVCDIARLCGQYEVVGFVDDLQPERHLSTFCGLPILGGVEQLEQAPSRGIHHIVIAVGDCEARMRLASFAREKSLELATVVHPSAVVAQDVAIGAGTVIAAGAVINPGSQIGSNVIVNTSASIDHDCTISDGSHICPGVRLAGSVGVGLGSWIGIGSVVIQKVQIGAWAVIGAGAVVISNIPDNALAYGVPAKVQRRKVRAREQQETTH